MSGDKQPSVWGDIEVIALPACHEAAQKHGDASHPDLKYRSPEDADNYDTDDEAWAESTDCPLGSINQYLMVAAREYARKAKSDSQCAMCPFRRSQKPWRPREHLRRYHTKTNNWRASGRKKLRICVAFRDSDKLPNPGQIDGRPNYLRRSASTIRADFGINRYGGNVKK